MVLNKAQVEPEAGTKETSPWLFAIESISMPENEVWCMINEMALMVIFHFITCVRKIYLFRNYISFENHKKDYF